MMLWLRRSIRLFETASVVIGDLAPTLTLTSTSTDNDRCIAPFGGSIDITVGGSAGPFTFDWTALEVLRHQQKTFPTSWRDCIQ